MSWRRGDILITGSSVRIGDGDVEFPLAVIDAVSLRNGLIVVLMDPSAGPPHSGQFRNLVAIDVEGVITSTAETPATDVLGSYNEIVSSDPLMADAPSYRCEIDVATGQIIKATYYK